METYISIAYLFCYNYVSFVLKFAWVQRNDDEVINMDLCPAFKPCSRDAELCWDGSSETSYAWTIVWMQLAAGMLLLLYGDLCLVRISPIVVIIKRLTGKDLERTSSSGAASKRGGDAEKDRERDAFFLTKRTEENFLKDFLDPSVIPPNAGGLYNFEDFPASVWALTFMSMFTSFRYMLFARYVHSIISGSVGWACLASAFSTVLWLMIDHEEYCANAFGVKGTTEAYIEELGSMFSSLIRNFSFFPSLLFVGYVKFTVNNWGNWYGGALAIVSRNITLATFVGGACSAPVSIEVRKQLYTIYRYLNLAHALTYSAVSTRLSSYSYEKEYVHKLGLLTEEELPAFELNPHRRYMVSLWLVKSLEDLFEMDGWRGSHETKLQIMGQLNQLRSAHGLFPGRKDMPNLYAQVMFMIGSVWMILIIIGSPFSFLIYTGEGNLLRGTDSVQPMVLVAVSLMSMTLRLTYIMVYILRFPWVKGKETMPVHEFIALSDHQTFMLLRSLFGHGEVHHVASHN